MDAKFVPTSLGEIFVRVVGEGPPALLWHSMFTDGRSWDPVVRDLSEHRRLHVIDAPGFGRSAPLHRRSTIRECAYVADQILDQLGVIDQVDWIGAGWGGHVGMDYARTASHRVRSLTTIAAPTTRSPRRLLVRGLAHALGIFGPAGPLMSQLLRLQFSDSTRADPLAAAVVEVPCRTATRATLKTATLSFVLDRLDVTAEAEMIAAPTLVIATTDRRDWTPTEAGELARNIPNGTAVALEGTRTLASIEQPRALSTAILEHWRRIEMRAPSEGFARRRSTPPAACLQSSHSTAQRYALHRACGEGHRLMRGSGRT